MADVPLVLEITHAGEHFWEETKLLAVIVNAKGGLGISSSCTIYNRTVQCQTGSTVSLLPLQDFRFS